MMYGEFFDVTDEEMDMDFLLPIGKGNIEREGKDITLVGFAKVNLYYKMDYNLRIF
jgi:pyruvate dehydrogenase E1 component beta subunit